MTWSLLGGGRVHVAVGAGRVSSNADLYRMCEWERKLIDIFAGSAGDSRGVGRPASRRILAAATAVVVAASLSACTTSANNSNAGGTAPIPTGGESGAARAVDGFEKYYTQELDWSDCGAGFQCADVEAPMDWSDPTSEAIDLAIKFYPARTSKPMGTILVNPGGPGGSGTEFVEYAPHVFGEKLLNNYSVLGFDPRGVEQSTAVECLDADAMDAYLALSLDPERPEALKVMEKEAKAFGQACLENTGEVLGFVDTQSSARDMDMLSALMGDKSMNYLGYSYGTQLGATYAGLFPKSVGKMVLDGAIDLRLTPFEQSKQQAVGFENALRAYAEDCVKQGTCPVKGNADAVMKQVGNLLDRLAKQPLPTDSTDRVLTQSLAFYGVAQPLYSESMWSRLNSALKQAIVQGDGSELLDLSDDYFGRDSEGNYMDNQTEAFTAINCLDERSTTDLEQMKKEAAELKEAAPVMGSFFGFGGIGCANWPFDAVERTFDLAAPGAEPIMVIGTTNDPATPYDWAVGLAEQLESGFLVTHVGEGHTAYGMGSTCILNAVDDFFVDGTIPKVDPRCSA